MDSGVIIALIVFVLGAFGFGHVKKSRNTKKILRQAEEELDAKDLLAKQVFQEAKLRAAKERERKIAEAKAEADSRPHTDDPVADLRDRLDR